MQKFAVLAVLTACCTGVALAQTQSSLMLPVGTQARIRPAGQTYNGPAQVLLAPGDQACVTAGSASVTSGGVRRTLKAGACYQVPAPRSLLSSLAAVVSSWVPSSRKAGTANAESRNIKCDLATPGVSIPRDYPLRSLLVPITYPPNPRTLRLFSAPDEVLYTAEQGEADASFTVPLAAFKHARRLQVVNAFGETIYDGPVQWVDFAGPGGKDAAGLAERARQLLDTGLSEYLLPAYSLLVQAGEAQAARTLLDDVINAC